MFQDNPLLAQLKKQMQDELPKKEGTIKGTDRGFGFLETDDKKDNLFIPPPYMKKVIHGDRVTAIVRTEKEREIAEPQTLVEQGMTRFVGRIKLIKKRLFVVPDHQQRNDPIAAKLVKGLTKDQFVEGDWVVANITRHPLTADEGGFQCQISEKIAASDDHIAPWWVTLAHNDLPNSEPEGRSEWPLLDEGLLRKDLTELPFITIDGDSTKDMDDALHTTQHDDGTFTLTIAIADPTAYIAADDALDAEARSRGFTIYLPGKNIPMLPRELADDLCSLIDNQQRPAICCEVTIAEDGTIQDDFNFFAANIVSHGRLSYNNVSDFIEQQESTSSLNNDVWQPSSEIAPQLLALRALAKARTTWRETHAVTFPDRPDYRFELGENSEVLAIHVDERRIANRMVEEAMITANICAGKLLQQKFNLGIFNTHAGFSAERFNDVMSILEETEAPFEKEQLLTVEGFSALRRWLNQQPSTYWDSRLRKHQSYSLIAQDPAPHYAMGLEVYATWTSPIRKYGDMINHRLIKAAILDHQDEQTIPQDLAEELMLHRRHHRMAERTISDWLYTMLLADDVEKKTVFSAEIFDINRAGMRVRLLENGAAAFIPGSLICDTKSRIECSADKGMILIDNRPEFKLGDVVDVYLSEVKKESRNLIAAPVLAFLEPTQITEENK
ncbi:exoribonuclease II [Vibrio sp. SS-MA-C1-2]|uniref:exoribonuclease II n=1 Tax=Vibrio sp. SS-MA-C1-2 TaxID=2908646 RepID=UPI001F247F13|nr:exoribonuclease II [Vibrio sp. SS-MA-C1-2]UJF16834.1 exoribonuclease II [Vibrio sp. SS-MA-C1-2]